MVRVASRWRQWDDGGSCSWEGLLVINTSSPSRILTRGLTSEAVTCAMNGNTARIAMAGRRFTKSITSSIISVRSHGLLYYHYYDHQSFLIWISFYIVLDFFFCIFRLNYLYVQWLLKVFGSHVCFWNIGDLKKVLILFLPNSLDGLFTPKHLA